LQSLFFAYFQGFSVILYINEAATEQFRWRLFCFFLFAREVLCTPF